MTTHQYTATSGILICIVEQAVQQLLQQGVGIHHHVVSHFSLELCDQHALLFYSRGVQVVTVQDRAHHFVEPYSVWLR